VLPLLIIVIVEPSIFLALFSTICLPLEQHGCGWAERQFYEGGRCHYSGKVKGDRWHYQVK